MVSSLNLSKIRAEIAYINGQFQNLRTFIVPDPNCERVDLFYFVMFPADGSLADKPVVGKMFFPHSFPAYPPVLHLFTLTQRYNVDVFHNPDEKSLLPMSSMCFDILERFDARSCPHGLWTSQLTLPAVFASLLQVLVSVKVKQKYSNHEIDEFVSMRKMIVQHEQVDQVWSKYKSYFVGLPRIKKVRAKKVRVHDQIHFARSDLPVKFEKSSRIYSSNGFRLDEADFSVLIDLSEFRKKLELTKHRYNFVVSVILSNRLNDPLGKLDGTILIRNGITGTAAKKLRHNKINWFYHGKPLVDFERIYVTVAHSQITMVVENETNADDNTNLNIHGDTVLSYLTQAEMGEILASDLFYLSVYVESKETLEFLESESEARKKFRDGIYIHLNTENKFGFVHPSNRFERAVSPRKADSEASSRISVDLNRLVLNDYASYAYLNNLIKFYEDSLKFNPKNSCKVSVKYRPCPLSAKAREFFQDSEIQLDTRNISYLKQFLDEYRMTNLKLVKEQQEAATKKQLALASEKPGLKAFNQNRPSFNSTKNQNSQVSSAQFWSKLSLSKQAVAQISPAVDVDFNKNNNAYDEDKENVPEKQTDSVCSSGFHEDEENNKASNSDNLDKVVSVDIYLSKNSYILYKDILSQDNKQFLIYKYDRIINPGYIKLSHVSDFGLRSDFEMFVKKAYVESQLVEFSVTGYVYDDCALALIFDSALANKRKHFKFYPATSRSHLCATILSNGPTKPSYCDKLLSRAVQMTTTSQDRPNSLGSNQPVLKYFDQPVKCLGQIKFFRPSFVLNKFVLV